MKLVVTGPVALLSTLWATLYSCVSAAAEGATALGHAGAAAMSVLRAAAPAGSAAAEVTNQVI